MRCKMVKRRTRLLPVMVIAFTMVNLATQSVPGIPKAYATQISSNEITSGREEELSDSISDGGIMIKESAGAESSVTESGGVKEESEQSKNGTEGNTDEEGAGGEHEPVILEIRNPKHKGNKKKGISGSGTYNWKVKTHNSQEAYIDDAGEGIRKALLTNASAIEISFGDFDVAGNTSVNHDDGKYGDYLSEGNTNGENIQYVKLAAQLLESSCVHTGTPEEGDYLLNSILSATYEYRHDLSRGEYSLLISDLNYLSGSEKQSYVKEMVSRFIQENNIAGKDPFRQIKAVYDYLHKNISYESNGADTAGDALEEGAASSMGLCSLAYYMLNSMDIDTRIISGGNKDWLIVSLGDKYYYLDPAEDSSAAEEDSYRYFLSGDRSFSKTHEPGWQFTADSFKSSYPISDEDYIESSVTLDRSEAKLAVGGSLQLNAASSNGETVKYSSSDDSIASVSNSGLVTAIKEGKTVITARVRDGEASCIVHVVSEPEVIVTAKDNVTQYVSGTGSYFEGDVVTITAVRETRDGYLFDEWNMLPEVKYLDGGSKKDYRVSFYMPAGPVKAEAVYSKIAVSSILVDHPKFEMKAGTQKSMGWTVEPSNAFTGDMMFKSSNEDIATVDDKGTVTAVAAGTAKITLSCSGAEAACDITVTGEEYTIHVTGRNTAGVVKTQDKIVTAGEEITISVPNIEKYGYKFDKWLDRPAGITYVDGYDNSSIKTRFVMPDCDLSMEATYKEIVVESIKLKNERISINAGKTYKLKQDITVSPTNALEKALTYSSSDESVARVSTAGVITGVNEGDATIKISCGDITATCEVTVKGSGSTASGTEYLRLNAASLKMYVGRTYKLSVSSRNAGTVSFSSDNNSIASVDSSGTVTGISAGECTVTAVSSSGKTSDTVKVTVVELTSTSAGTGNKVSNARMLKYKASAAKYRADADKLRADAIRNGLWEADSAVTKPSVYEPDADTTGKKQAMQTTVSQPTGDYTALWFWVSILLLVGILSSAFYMANKKRRKINKREPLIKKVGADGNLEDSRRQEKSDGK